MKLHHNGITRFGCGPNENRTIEALGGEDVGKSSNLYSNCFFYESAPKVATEIWKSRDQSLIISDFLPELYDFEQSRLQPEDCYCSFLISNADEVRRRLYITDQRSKCQTTCRKDVHGICAHHWCLRYGRIEWI